MTEYGLSLFFCLLFCGNIAAQNSIVHSGTEEKNTPKDTPVEEHIYDILPINPEFVGGQRALIKFLQQNTKYPRTAIENEKQGTVVVQFVVEKDGSLSDLKVITSVGYGCDEEAMRVVGLMPKFNPGKLINGEPARCYHTCPVVFALE